MIHQNAAGLSDLQSGCFRKPRLRRYTNSQNNRIRWHRLAGSKGNLLLFNDFYSIIHN